MADINNSIIIFIKLYAHTYVQLDIDFIIFKEHITKQHKDVVAVNCILYTGLYVLI